MNAKQIHLGFEVGSGEPVEIPVRHMAVTGQTQESGKTTTLTALIERAKLPAIAFLTKRGEKSLQGRQILPFFQERADWPFVQAILESTMRERMKFERAWIVRACKGASTLADVQRNVAKLQEKEKRAMSQDMYMLLGEYLQRVVPLLATLPKTSRVDLREGLAVMDLERYPLELQMLVISSTLAWIHQHAEGVITIMPEAWKFVPQGRNTPAKIAAENLAREGAGLRNYLWIDSQDMAAVDKMLLRACAVWLIGTQREANEIKRSLDNMPAGLKKPKAADVATLELGQFFACFGREIRKTYVQPAWMPEEIARMVSKDELLLSDTRTSEWKLVGNIQLLGPGQPPTTGASAGSGDDYREQARPISSRNEEDDVKVEVLDRELQRIQGLIEAGEYGVALNLVRSTRDAMSSKNSPASAAAATAAETTGSGQPALAAPVQTSARQSYSPTPQEPFDSEGLLQAIKGRVMDRLYQAIKERLMDEAPALVKVLAQRPEIKVEVNRSTVTVDDSSLKGKIALLIHEGWFGDEGRDFGEIRKEAIRRGLDSKTPNVKTSDALKDFVRMGFFWQNEGNTFLLAPGARERVEAA